MNDSSDIILPEDRILVTGAAGFIGSRVVSSLLKRGFRNIACLVRPASDAERLGFADASQSGGRVVICRGNLLSPADCRRVAEGVKVVYHLAAGTGLKAHSDAVLNSVVTTRNLLDACIEHGELKRFVNLSSFSVYTNRNLPRRGVLDERGPVEKEPKLRAEAYCYAKVKQDELVEEYGRRFSLPFVHIRPGVVYGPGKYTISGRVGIDSFGIYLHLGGPTRLPLTYVDNCADSIVLAGLRPGIDGETFNIVDDDLPTSRKFLRLYKKHVRRFPSIYVPHAMSWAFCAMWEQYCKWSENQLPPAFTRREWAASWKKVSYPNDKAKRMLGWQPTVPTGEGLDRYFTACRENLASA
jgi:nucleoside-diphosphate-sugar epimerase